jgi:transcriptional regulator with XRE-family HTH domain
MRRNNKLQRARLAKNLTQMELADKAGLCWMTISRIERGLSKAKPQTRRAICKALRLPWSRQAELFGALPKAAR